MEDVFNQELLLKIVQSIDILELDLSVRTGAKLRHMGIDTIGKLCRKTKLDLLGMDALNYRSINEIEKKLKEIGLNLKQTGGTIVTRKDWKTLPTADVTISFTLPLRLSENRYTSLKHGRIPSNMDQWFIYFEQGELHFYRCTGLRIFSVTLDEVYHKHHVKTYVYDLDDIVSWKEESPNMIKMILEDYTGY